MKGEAEDKIAELTRRAEHAEAMVEHWRGNAEVTLRRAEAAEMLARVRLENHQDSEKMRGELLIERSGLLREMELCWKECGVTPEQRAANDDPDCETLSQTVHWYVQHERDKNEQAHERIGELEKALAETTDYLSSANELLRDEDDGEDCVDADGVIAAARALLPPREEKVDGS